MLPEQAGEQRHRSLAHLRRQRLPRRTLARRVKQVKLLVLVAAYRTAHRSLPGGPEHDATLLPYRHRSADAPTPATVAAPSEPHN